MPVVCEESLTMLMQLGSCMEFTWTPLHPTFFMGGGDFRFPVELTGGTLLPL